MSRAGNIAAIAVCLAAAQPGFNVGLNGQQSQQNTRAPRVLARISYESTYVSDANERRSPQICFEIYQNGRYKMRRMQKAVAERLGGNLSADELQELKRLLKSLDFKSSEGGLVQRGTETFAAEVAGKEDSNRYVWMNPDHQRPFPASAAKIIRWLQEFDDRRAAPFADPELSTDPICPRAAAKPVQPVRPS